MGIEYLSMDELIDLAVDIMMNKSIKDFNYKETAIVTKMLSNLEYFKNLQAQLGDKEILKISKCINLKYFSKKSTVIKCGEEGNTFYIILKGEVEVFVPDYKHIQDNFELIKLTNLKSGHAFGDLAIIRKKPRAATVQCLSDCVLAEIDYESYVTLLQEIENEKITKFVTYLRNFEIFRSLNKSHLIRFYFVGEKKTFKKGEIVYREKDPIDGLYLIREGEFSVFKKVVDKKDDLEEIEKDIAKLKKEQEVLLMGFHGGFDPRRPAMSRQNQKTLSSSKMDKILTRKPPNYFELVILKDLEIFGEIEMFDKEHEKRTLSIKCKSPRAEVFFFPKENFAKLQTPLFIEGFKQFVKKRCEFYNNRYKQDKNILDNVVHPEKNISSKNQFKNNVKRNIIKLSFELKPQPQPKIGTESKNNCVKLRSPSLSKDLSQKTKIIFKKIPLNNFKFNTANKRDVNNRIKTDSSETINIKPFIMNTVSTNFLSTTQKSVLNTEYNDVKSFNTTSNNDISRNKEFNKKYITETYIMEDTIDNSLSYKAKLNVTNCVQRSYIEKVPKNIDMTQLKELNNTLFNFHKRNAPLSNKDVRPAEKNYLNRIQGLKKYGINLKFKLSDLIKIKTQETTSNPHLTTGFTSQQKVTEFKKFYGSAIKLNKLNLKHKNTIL